MYFRFISDKSVRWYCELEAKSLKDALKAVKSGNVQWEREPDEFDSYHRIEIAKDEQAMMDGDYEEDENTRF